MISKSLADWIVLTCDLLQDKKISWDWLTSFSHRMNQFNLHSYFRNWIAGYSCKCHIQSCVYYSMLESVAISEKSICRKLLRNWILEKENGVK